MSGIKDGGPAFPGNPHHVDCVPDAKTGGTVATVFVADKGMTLRDYFAAKALSGLLAQPEDRPGFENFAQCCAYYTDLAYAYADSMLTSRDTK